MYAKQKMEAQKQLEDPSCDMVKLKLDIECRLVSKNAPATADDDEKEIAVEALPGDEEAAEEGQVQTIEDLEALLARDDLSPEQRKKLKKKLKKKRQQQRK